ncbi:MAG: immune inhibitor A [Ignavibacteriales bacterium]|nr:immune inhibitor A [Ignavibacteriales bacterium]
MKKMYLYFIVAALLFSHVLLKAEDFKQVKVYLTNPQNDIQRLGRMDFDIEHSVLENKNQLILFIAESEVAVLQNAGFKFDIMISSWETYFKNLPKMTDAEKSRAKAESKALHNVEGFGFGSHAGFYTVAEVNQQLDSMKIHFPNLITSKFLVGMTVENKPIYGVKISDNPDQNENEPEVLYTGMHHAREPQGMMAVMYYMFYLLENYNTNPSVKYLVDNRQIYFIPVVNVDGYEYNRTSSPSGGGMWRKNRKNNGDGTYGIDLNRNYGPMNYWNANNGGSSTSTSSETYRGTAPFSESEVAAMRDFVNGHRFKTALNYHTYSNLLIFPYGALGHETPDSLIFREYGNDMVAYNGYELGTDLQTVGYSTRGNSDDFMYDGDLTTRGKVIVMTPEVGGSSDGFWPEQNRIFPLAIENLMPNLYYTWVAGEYVSLNNVTFSQQYINPGDNVQMNFALKNKGLSTGYNLQLQLSAVSQYVTVTSGSLSVDSVSARSVYQPASAFAFSIAPNAPIQEKVKLVLKIYTGSSLMASDTISVVLGTPSFVFRDTTTAPSALWNITGTPTGTQLWDATTSSYVSAPNSFTDSKNGNYANNITVTMITKNAINLTGLANPVLTYMTKWDIETKWDCGVVSISTNNGSSWIPLAGQYTKPGSGSGTQVLGVPCYDGTKASWVKEEISFSAYVGQQVKLKFEFKTDGSQVRDGWYLDDIGIFTYVQPVQVTWASTLNVKDAGNTQSNLVFGLSPVATDGIDAQLGEVTLPPLPPSGVYDARMELPVTPAEFSFKDFRRDTLTTATWKLLFQPGAGGYPFTFTWEPSLLPAGNFTLKDAITGAIVNVNMKNQGSYVLENSNIMQLKIEYTKQTCQNIQIASGWNLVSAPYAANVMTASVLFPQATSPMYAYNNGYTTAAELNNGKGYWVRYGSAVSQSMCGNMVNSNVVPVVSGWNLVGVYSNEAAVAQITSNPAGIINSVYYGYANGYTTASALQPGKGYWVRASQSGQLLLPSPGVQKTTVDAQQAINSNWIKIAIADAVNNTAILYGAGADNDNNPAAFLPPQPPAGIFDIRFEGDRAIANLATNPATIQLSQMEYPVKLSVTGGSLRITHAATGGKLINSIVNESTPITINNQLIKSLRVERVDVPANFGLMQNYPNPFNPSTTIKFSIPEKGETTLRIYNQLGEMVGELLNKELDKGFHSIEFNAQNFASGVYLYELKTAGFRSVKKLMLVK